MKIYCFITGVNMCGPMFETEGISAMFCKLSMCAQRAIVLLIAEPVNVVVDLVINRFHDQFRNKLLLMAPCTVF
jgi:hypothetical protein